MPNDTEVQKLYIYVGTQAKINEARQAGTIGPDDFAVVTDAPEFALQSTVQAIQVLIPSQASSSNQLADKNYVASSTLPSSTKYGASFVLSINSSDYKVTAALKDQDGNTLGTQQVIDLPLESVVVGGSYDSTNKKIILTLQNGNTIDVPVGDLVAGLQTEITAQNKLASDLVDDTNQTNKFVTASEKTTWNNKQNAITGGASTITSDNLTPQRVLVSNSQGKVAAYSVTQTELSYLSGTTSAIQTQLNSKANTTDVNTALDKKIDKGYAVNDFATNCITGIPQNIKLELSSGTLTLKSGAVITLPNGTQLQTVSNLTYTSEYSGNRKLMVCVRENGTEIYVRDLVNCVSGPGATTSGGFAYDTTTNEVWYCLANGTKAARSTFPIAICTITSGSITSIDQVFNGFGYIGSSVFCLPGVKGLVPNGRNTDGTLNVNSFTVSSLLVLTGSGNMKNVGIYVRGDSLQFYGRPYAIFKRVEDIPSNFGGMAYIIDTNELYTVGSGSIQAKQTYSVAGTYDWTSDAISRFEVYPIAGLSSNYINTALGYTPYNSNNPSGYITQAVDDNSTTSTTLGWSASKLNGIIGDIETALQTINSGV